MIKVIKAKIPLLVIFAVLGVLLFPLKDLLTGSLFSLWIDNTAIALLASAALGAVIGLLLGAFILWKNGAHFLATPDEIGF